MSDKRIYKSLFLLALVIFSYVGLLFFISNEGIKGTSPVQNSVEMEMTKRAVPLQDANFDEIQINKNLLNIE